MQRQEIMENQQEEVQKATILIVEDDESTGDILNIVVSQETPYRSLLVTNGAAALEILQEKQADLFILDYRLPDMTGVELYDRLKARKEFKNIPTILMSASKPVGDIEPRDVVLLSKPFDLDNLLDIIENLMKHTVLR